MNSKRQDGYTLIELTAVVTILLILVAIIVPVIFNTVYSWRIRGAADDLSGLIQRARSMAEQSNTTLPVYTGAVESGQGAFIGTVGSTWASGEPAIPYDGTVSNGTAAAAPAALSPGFTAEPAGTILYFNPRGLPVMSSGGTFVPSSGVIYYITDTHGNWSAVSVTATGRSKAWLWTGSWH
jgi:prepilin-type N-terminal cleavage/methylation domain-containing protein